MKQLVCEMCGSTDLVKDGGVFVCQSCGCKYSAEEARKMMIEGTVAVSGTVRVDASPQIANLEKNIVRLSEEGKDAEGYAECREILRLDSKNPWGRAFQELFDNAQKAQTKQYSYHVPEVCATLNTMRSRSKTLDEYLDFVIACAKKSKSVELARKNWIREERDRIKHDLDYNALKSVTYGKNPLDNQLERIELESRQRRFEAMVDMDDSGQTLEIMEAALKNIDDLSVASIEKISALGKIVFFDFSSYEKREQLLEIIITAELEAKAAYWKKHPEEEAELKRELEEAQSGKKRELEQADSLQKQLEELTSRREAVLPVERERDRIEKEVADQLNELASIGLFKRKEKRALSEKIEAGKERIEELNRKAKKEREELLAQLDPKIADLKKEIEEKEITAGRLSNKASNINNKLGKESAYDTFGIAKKLGR